MYRIGRVRFDLCHDHERRFTRANFTRRGRIVASVLRARRERARTRRRGEVLP
jgi:hypothetical protein